MSSLQNPVSRRSLVAAAAASIVPSAAMAQPGFPNKPITIIVPYTAGGASDIVNDVVAGQIDIGVTTVPNVVALAAQGHARAGIAKAQYGDQQHRDAACHGRAATQAGVNRFGAAVACAVAGLPAQGARH